MGFQDRRYRDGGGDYGEGGGFRRAFRRMFVEGDNFFNWAIPLYRLAGITVKVHILYIAFVAGELLFSASPGAAGFWFRAFFYGCGFVFVLLHEYGHCIACRMVGGEAHQIVMWPLGGLAFVRPPHRWKAALITTACGPAVNLAIAVLIGGTMRALGAGWDVVFFNLLKPFGQSGEWLNVNAAYWKELLFFAYAWNIYNFLFNVLLPMFPMDGGRIVQELLWWRLGYKRSMVIATNLGLLVAVLVGVFAQVTQAWILFSIALFGGITCFMQRRALAMVEDEPAWAQSGDLGVRGPGGEGGGASSAQDMAYKAAMKRQQKDEQSRREVDRILAKIRAAGMQSLTSRERTVLREETERSKGRE